MADDDSRAGASYATPAILDWLAGVHAPHDAALARAFDAPGEHGMPAIQLGASEAKAVALLLRLAGAKKVVEVGTLAGYSALVMARALPEDGHVWTIEFDPKHAAVARANVAAAGLANRVTVLDGAGLDVLPSLEREAPFDAVFVDADKRNYDALRPLGGEERPQRWPSHRRQRVSFRAAPRGLRGSRRAAPFPPRSEGSL